ncbi:hypothetical protein SDRG_01632 [Saprolegnia diclina VS20]|uniref:Uncharacterized protein n=1 Tax=Saprolegnia diclina (strain VS20) TaxID=1156394 RepID=T0QU02_SAPDV|nr:hypothetical protein SDRG_01632 [Saprolegnia diclina VS20]EQC41674.1 hypothetical protein SDRG_01632 [Saprolegnia diclina VS20]|eukprot:XP_008605388.1 hypothetical protein SDRG_01632 [Saprolegnia diclina VS20]
MAGSMNAQHASKLKMMLANDDDESSDDEVVQPPAARASPSPPPAVREVPRGTKPQRKTRASSCSSEGSESNERRKTTSRRRDEAKHKKPKKARAKTAESDGDSDHNERRKKRTSDEKKHRKQAKSASGESRKSSRDEVSKDRVKRKRSECDDPVKKRPREQALSAQSEFPGTGLTPLNDGMPMTMLRTKASQPSRDVPHASSSASTDVRSVYEPKASSIVASSPVPAALPTPKSEQAPAKLGTPSSIPASPSTARRIQTASPCPTDEDASSAAIDTTDFLDESGEVIEEAPAPSPQSTKGIATPNFRAKMDDRSKPSPLSLVDDHAVLPKPKMTPRDTPTYPPRPTPGDTPRMRARPTPGGTPSLRPRSTLGGTPTARPKTTPTSEGKPPPLSLDADNFVIPKTTTVLPPLPPGKGPSDAEKEPGEVGDAPPVLDFRIPKKPSLRTTPTTPATPSAKPLTSVPSVSAPKARPPTPTKPPVSFLTYSGVDRKFFKDCRQVSSILRALTPIMRGRPYAVIEENDEIFAEKKSLGRSVPMKEFLERPPSFYGIDLTCPMPPRALSAHTAAQMQRQTNDPYGSLVELQTENRVFLQTKLYKTTFMPLSERRRVTVLFRHMRMEQKSAGFGFNMKDKCSDFAKTCADRFAIDGRKPSIELTASGKRDLQQMKPTAMYVHYFSEDDANEALRRFQDDAGAKCERQDNMYAVKPPPVEKKLLRREPDRPQPEPRRLLDAAVNGGFRPDAPPRSPRRRDPVSRRPSTGRDRSRSLDRQRRLQQGVPLRPGSDRMQRTEPVDYTRRDDRRRPSAISPPLPPPLPPTEPRMHAESSRSNGVSSTSDHNAAGSLDTKSSSEREVSKPDVDVATRKTFEKPVDHQRRSTERRTTTTTGEAVKVAPTEAKTPASESKPQPTETEKTTYVTEKPATKPEDDKAERAAVDKSSTTEKVATQSDVPFIEPEKAVVDTKKVLSIADKVLPAADMKPTSADKTPTTADKTPTTADKMPTTAEKPVETATIADVQLLSTAASARDATPVKPPTETKAQVETSSSSLEAGELRCNQDGITSRA